MKKETLKVADNDLQDDLLLYAISSSESDIRICQTINRILGINLALAESLSVSKGKKGFKYRRYIYESEEEIEKFLLLVNRNEGIFLFPELKKIDYIFIVITESPKAPIEDYMQRLKVLPEITALYKVDQLTLKSFNKIPL